MHSLQELSDSNGRKNGENFDFQSYFRTANLFLEHEMFQVKMTPDKIDVSRSEGVKIAQEFYYFYEFDSTFTNAMASCRALQV